ncbi:MAG: phosphatidate cytidylyltransferase [Kiloniellales bacterium]|nr:phosphatidate cytidylyltransferase [Kiloniellales bacterium]
MAQQPNLTERQSPRMGKGSELGKRVLSALVLAPVVLIALYAGSPYSDILVLVAGVLMIWEWSTIIGCKPFGTVMVVAIVMVGLSLVFAAFGYYQIAVWLCLAGAAGCAFFDLNRQKDETGREMDDEIPNSKRSLWLAFGIIYLCLACLSFLWLRSLAFEVILLVLIIVWVTDTGAYFVGRKIGGAKLAPKISPGKTWAGFFGGVVLAAFAAAGMTLIYEVEGFNILKLFVVGGVLAAVSQAGDLLESHLKRQHNVKDSSGLSPGHGGILDRADGLLAAVLCLGGMIWSMDLGFIN